jgi:hypothetical protein
LLLAALLLLLGLLDPAVKKIFIDKDQTLAWLIPILIILAFSCKRYFSLFSKNKYNKSWTLIAGELQKKIANVNHYFRYSNFRK